MYHMPLSCHRTPPTNPVSCNANKRLRDGFGAPPTPGEDLPFLSSVFLSKPILPLTGTAHRFLLLALVEGRLYCHSTCIPELLPELLPQRKMKLYITIRDGGRCRVQKRLRFPIQS